MPMIYSPNGLRYHDITFQGRSGRGGRQTQGFEIIIMIRTRKSTSASLSSATTSIFGSVNHIL